MRIFRACGRAIRLNLRTRDRLPARVRCSFPIRRCIRGCGAWSHATSPRGESRSEEHTSELQSRSDLVCRLLLEKKKTQEKRILYKKKKKNKNKKNKKNKNK